eukprot:13374709-Alexandrium_andersonii.AAC.1
MAGLANARRPSGRDQWDLDMNNVWRAIHRRSTQQGVSTEWMDNVGSDASWPRLVCACRVQAEAIKRLGRSAMDKARAKRKEALSARIAQPFGQL